MDREESVSKIEFAGIYAVFGFILLFQYSRAFTHEEMFLFFELILAYAWTMGLIVYAKSEFKPYDFTGLRLTP